MKVGEEMCDRGGMRRMCTFAYNDHDECDMMEGNCDLDTIRHDTI